MPTNTVETVAAAIATTTRTTRTTTTTTATATVTLTFLSTCSIRVDENTIPMHRLGGTWAPTWIVIALAAAAAAAMEVADVG